MVGLKSLIFLVIVHLLSTCSVPAFSLLGFQFPSPENIPGDSSPVYFDPGYNGISSNLWLQPGDRLPYAAFAVTSRIAFYLSKEGDVDSILMLEPTGAQFIDGIRNSLSRLRFSPAFLDTSPCPSILPAELLFTIRQDKGHAFLRVPFLASNGYKNRKLIDQMMILNGFNLPVLRKFPSYFCKAGTADRKESYNFAIFEIMLDSQGNPVDATEYCSSNADYSKLLGLAAFYAEYLPASFHKERFESGIFVMVRFFPELEYPTHLWPNFNLPSQSYPFEFIRLKSDLYLDSIINPAIPANIPGGIINWPDFIPLNDSVWVKVKIDTMGQIVSHSFYTPVWGEKDSLTEQILRSLQFIPARDISNSVCEFSGSLMIRFQSGRNIRIEADWLPIEAQPESRITN